MFILKTGHQPGVYVPLRALFLVVNTLGTTLSPASSQSVQVGRTSTASWV